MNKQRVNELIGLLFLTVGVLIFISLVSYNPSDLSFFTSVPSENISNFAGIAGAYVAAAILFVFGWGAHIIPTVCLTWAVSKFIDKEPQKIYLKITGTVVLFLASCILLSMLFEATNTAKVQAGGVVGLFLSNLLVKYFGGIGTYLIAATLVFMSALLATEFLILPFVITLYDGLKEKLKIEKATVVHKGLSQKTSIAKGLRSKINKGTSMDVEEEDEAPLEIKVKKPKSSRENAP